MAGPELDDPLKGRVFCEKHIALIEKMIDAAIEKGDTAEASKLEWTLANWAKLLEKFLHQIYQQGLAKTDITYITSRKRKQRFDAEPAQP